MKNNMVFGIVDRSCDDALITVFIAPSDNVAQRNFFDLLTSPEDSIFPLHPDDFKLVKILDENSNVQTFINGSDFAPSLLSETRQKRLDFCLKAMKKDGD